MDVARGQVEGLAAAERHAVEEERRDDAGVSRVGRGQLPHGAHLGRELAALPVGGEAREQRDAVDEAAHLGSAAHEEGERVAQYVRLGAREARQHRADHGRVGVGPRRVEREQQRECLPHLGERAEAAERVELVAEREDQLGLVQRVLVVPVRRVDRDAAVLLVAEAAARAVEVRVRLQRQRAVGREHLEEEREAGAVARAEAPGERTERGRGVRVDPLGQRPRAADRRRVDHAGGRAVVRPEPELRLRAAGRLAAEQLGDGGAGTPGVVAWGVGEGSEHVGILSGLAATYNARGRASCPDATKVPTDGAAARTPT